MKVKELIEKLQALEQDAKVYVICGGEISEAVDVDSGFVDHLPECMVFSKTPPARMMDINHPSWVASAVAIGG